MRSWKLWTFGIVFIVILAGAAAGSALWNNLSQEWQVEENAAQYALDHSPIQSITEHDVFTANGAQEVFFGKDPFGRMWVAFVSGSPFTMHAVPEAGIWSKAKIKTAATAHGIKVQNEHLGYLDDATRQSINLKTDVVWEVYGKTSGGTLKYAYFDAHTGRMLESY